MNLRYTGEAPEKEINELFSDWLVELFAADDKAVWLDADLMSSLRVQGLWKERPDRVFNCGIQEANMVGVAAGLYLAGYHPYAHSFTPFITRRAYDQLFVSAAYAHKSIHLIGSDVGILASANGGTHMCFEDIALLRAVPGACIVDVTDAVMFHGMLKAAKDWLGVTYFRTPRRGAPDVYEEGTEFEVGKGLILTEGRDVTLIASGIMTATALDAQRQLEKQGISVQVIDPITIKPLDEDLILRSAAATGAVVTAENHSVIGGLGSAVAELLLEKLPVPMYRVGVRDRFGQTGTVDYLRKEYQLTAQDIATQIRAVLARKK